MDDGGLTLATDPDWRRLARVIEGITGQAPSAEQGERFRLYLDLILTWSRSQRLTGFRTVSGIVEGLFIDSLLFFPLLPPRPCAVIDIGSGVGVPGLPLRILDQGCRLTLVESRRKRVSFLKAAIRELGLLDVEVIHGRAEDVVMERSDLAGRYDAAVARSAGGLHEVVSMAMRYLKPGAVCVVSGPPSEPGGHVDQKLREAGAQVRTVTFPALSITRRFLLFFRRS